MRIFLLDIVVSFLYFGEKKDYESHACVFKGF